MSKNVKKKRKKFSKRGKRVYFLFDRYRIPRNTASGGPATQRATPCETVTSGQLEKEQPSIENLFGEEEGEIIDQEGNALKTQQRSEEEMLATFRDRQQKQGQQTDFNSQQQLEGQMLEEFRANQLKEALAAALQRQKEQDRIIKSLSGALQDNNAPTGARASARDMDRAEYEKRRQEEDRLAQQIMRDERTAQELQVK